MKVFIIDDDQLSLFLTKTTLVLEGTTQHITTFLEASEALEILKNSSSSDMPDVILLDLNMPEMNGWEFLDALLPFAPKFTATCKIYILTSSLDTSDAERSKEYSIVAGLIHKPLQNTDIKMIVSQYHLLEKSIS